MSYCVIFVVVLAIIAGFTTHTAKLPSNFKLCHLSDPNVNECVRIGVESAIHDLKDGAPEVGLQSLEPLLIDQLVIGQGNGPVNVQQNFKNCKLHGLTGSKVLEEKVSLDENLLFARSLTPSLRLECDYNMNGRVLLLPVSGDGPCNVTLINTYINHTLHGERFERKGKTYMKFKDYDVTLRPEKMTYKFDNLFNGDERLGNEINKVLNENWDAVFNDVRDGYEKSFGLIFKELANRVFTRVPLNDIFLE